MPTFKAMVTKEQAQVRLKGRTNGANAFDRLQWLQLNFPGFTDRYIGGSTLDDIGAWYGLTSEEVNEMVSWVDTDVY